MKKELNALTMQRRITAERLARFANPQPLQLQEGKTENSPPKTRRRRSAASTIGAAVAVTTAV